MSEWATYIDQIISKLDYDTNEWKAQNVCSDAAIYGHDGTCWAFSPTFPELLTYDHEIEDLGGNKTPVNVNEVEIAKAAAEGTRNPSDAGIRLGNKKYMFVRHDDSGERPVTQLSCSGGGAIVSNCNSGVVIALFDKEKKDSNGKDQNHSDVMEQVRDMAKYLYDSGY